MSDFRYAQFCPLARAAEVLGQRWVIPVLRELFAGPQRFSDLRRRLGRVSPSVLAERLASLERHAVIARRALPPPAASSVYELTAHGRALEPALLELTRWGVRLLAAPEPGDRLEPDWLQLGLRALARRTATRARGFELRARGTDGQLSSLRVVGGPQGTRVLEGEGPVDAAVEAPPLTLMGLVSGALPASALRDMPDVQVEGDPEALSDLPGLFELETPVAGGSNVPPDPGGPQGARP